MELGFSTSKEIVRYPFRSFQQCFLEATQCLNRHRGLQTTASFKNVYQDTIRLKRIDSFARIRPFNIKVCYTIFWNDGSFFFLQGNCFSARLSVTQEHSQLHVWAMWCVWCKIYNVLIENMNLKRCCWYCGLRNVFRAQQYDSSVGNTIVVWY